MISYDHSTQRTVLQIRDRLKSEGFKYWIDVEHMCTYIVFTSVCQTDDVTIIRPHRSTTHAATACCYRPSSVVCRSVCRSVTVLSPAKMVESIEMPFGLWTRVGPTKHLRVLGVVHTGAICLIPLNRRCAAAMWPFVKLLWLCYY